ncbi:alpha/beta hydrolase, partial [Ancylobacter sp. MQZ15Z-1]|nr:alpha/beta hydrolase [Ancylobacter mangrovi]
MEFDMDLQRRNLLGMAALGLATGPLALSTAAAQPAASSSTAHAEASAGRGAHTTFAPLKTVRAGSLDVGYAEAGPADGPVVLLLHGWPYDIHAYVDVAP